MSTHLVLVFSHRQTQQHRMTASHADDCDHKRSSRMPMHNPPHPGEALREDVLPALGMTEAEFAKNLGYPVERLAAALNGCNPISTGLAQCLEQAGLGMASIWLAEQAAYDLWHKQQ